MSSRLINHVLDLDLSWNHSAKLVFLVLADNANDQGICWPPSIPMIVQRTSLSESVVKKAFRDLEYAGLMVPTFSMDGETIYTIQAGTPSQVPKPKGQRSKPTLPVNDEAIALVQSFRARFDHVRQIPNSTNTHKELAAASALLASASANEVLDLADMALRDKFGLNRRYASSLELIASHFHELRAQFIQPKTVTRISRPWLEIDHP